MRVIIFLSVFFLASCSMKIFQEKGNAGKLRKGIKYEDIGGNAVYCLRDFLIGEDAGGYWQVVNQPIGEDLAPLLIGENPCIEWSDKECGLYSLRYIVGNPCCRDTAVVNPLKCCLIGISTCS